MKNPLRPLAVCAAVGLCSVTVGSADTWRGLTVAPEYRCSPYEADDYAYPPSVEVDLIAQMGGLIYDPYTGTCFTHRSETDIEHLIARSEAHDSGLCARNAATRAAFARDPLNLTLASPRVNRYQKRAADVAEWTPALNACWFAEQTIAVRQKYHLTIDAREVAAIEQLLAPCASTAMVITCDGAATPASQSTRVPPDPMARRALDATRALIERIRARHATLLHKLQAGVHRAPVCQTHDDDGNGVVDGVRCD